MTTTMGPMMMGMTRTMTLTITMVTKVLIDWGGGLNQGREAAKQVVAAKKKSNYSYQPYEF